nr:peptidoglycan editing factor PgeF [Bacilli bacterium]
MTGRMITISGVFAQGAVAGFSKRTGGVSEGAWTSLNVGLHVMDEAQCVIQNRHAIATDLGQDLTRMTFATQVHGANVAIIAKDSIGAGAKEFRTAIENVDALVTKERKVTLAIVAADCIAALMYDPYAGVIGAFHAGWRGATQGIATATLEAMVQQGANPLTTHLAIGPSIRRCCYEVDQPVIAKVKQRYQQLGLALHQEVIFEHEQHAQLDLATLVMDELYVAGVPRHAMLDVSICTHCMPGFYSHRRDQGKTGRHGGFIALR